MKQAFVILFGIVATLVLSSGNSYGQVLKPENLPPKDNQVVQAGEPKLDTVRCLMLVCDTIGGAHTSVGSVLPSSQAWNEGRIVWWQYGYEVVIGERYGMLHGATLYSSIKGAYYLDQNKKPLPSSIVVWMTKEIKN